MDTRSGEYRGYGDYTENGVRDLEQERPFGVGLVVVFGVVGALFNAFLALNAWVRAEKLDEAPILAIIFLVETVIGLGVAFGLWRLSEWARICAVLLYGLTFTINFVANLNEPLTASSLMTLVIPAAIVIYLIQPPVKDVFI